jgi:hypothetical protein
MLNAEKKKATIIKIDNKNLEDSLVKKIKTSSKFLSYIDTKFIINHSINGIKITELILRNSHFFVALSI